MQAGKSQPSNRQRLQVQSTVVGYETIHFMAGSVVLQVTSCETATGT